jgi:hypothetical protein
MLLPALASGEAPTIGTFSTETGITPSFCTPCVLGKRICGLPFSPSVEDCGQPPCVESPCIPILNKKVRCCLPGGCSLIDC